MLCACCYVLLTTFSAKTYLLHLHIHSHSHSHTHIVLCMFGDNAAVIWPKRAQEMEAYERQQVSNDLKQSNNSENFGISTRCGIFWVGNQGTASTIYILCVCTHFDSIIIQMCHIISRSTYRCYMVLVHLHCDFKIHC